MGKRTTVIAVVVSLIAVIPISVYASHQFDDVPSDHTFHSSIGWLAETGITRGCNPPANNLFCPDDNVTRGQMATFLQRFHDRFIGNGTRAIGLGVAARSVDAPPSTGSGVVDDMALNLQIPEQGVLVVTATADTFNEVEMDAFGCGINRGGSPSAALADSWRVVDLTASLSDSCVTSTAFGVSPGSQQVRLVLSGASGTTEIHAANMSAVLYTVSGAFGLLGEVEDVEMRPISDTPKGG